MLPLSIALIVLSTLQSEPCKTRAERVATQARRTCEKTLGTRSRFECARAHTVARADELKKCERR